MLDEFGNGGSVVPAYAKAVVFVALAAGVGRRAMDVEGQMHGAIVEFGIVDVMKTGIDIDAGELGRRALMRRGDLELDAGVEVAPDRKLVTTAAPEYWPPDLISMTTHRPAGWSCPD